MFPVLKCCHWFAAAGGILHFPGSFLRQLSSNSCQTSRRRPGISTSSFLLVICLQHRWHGPQPLPVNHLPKYLYITALIATRGHMELKELHINGSFRTVMSKRSILERGARACSPWPCRYMNDEYPISTVNLLSHAQVALKQPAVLGGN